jgi:hypothetical protein
MLGSGFGLGVLVLLHPAITDAAAAMRSKKSRGELIGMCG